MEQPAKKWISPKEYQEVEANSQEKIEYFNGNLRMMAGGTFEHSVLCMDVSAMLFNGLKGKSCMTFNSEMKIEIAQENTYVYPDASVVCGEVEHSEEITGAIGNPTLIVEVISSSSKNSDRGPKFHRYRKLPSLQNYLLIYQDKFAVESSYRHPDSDLWRIDDHEGLDAEFTIQSLDLTIKLSDLYANVKDRIDKMDPPKHPGLYLVEELVAKYGGKD
ncbi:hypothetical protein CEQ90_09520 [Lewinellaceae bacterium SD302]|nr:hypothetical protein CEQ90_09520 [Lewinellaceae bacterium SD302]